MEEIVLTSGIYAIKNTENGKVYVGQSVNVAKRLRDHLCNLASGSHRNAHLQAAWVKYGADSFETQVVEACAIEVLDARERAWIAYFKCTDPAYGYNRESGGNAQKAVSEATRAKMSAAHKGRVASPETRAKMSAARKGRVIPPETRAKLSAVGEGHVVSPETRVKMSVANRGLARSPETRAKISAAQRGNTRCLGRIVSPETRAKISAALRGCAKVR